MKIFKPAGLALGAALLGTGAEIAVLMAKKPPKDLPDDEDLELYTADADGRRFEDLYRFLSGGGDVPFTEEQAFSMLSAQADYLDRRYDCADFRAQLLFKIYKDCAGALSPRAKALILRAFR